MQHQSLTTEETLADGSLLAGRYRILAKVGEGGFGAVYKARDIRQRDRLVAIKRIDLDKLSPQQIIEATDSYNREVTLLSPLQHQNLPHVYEHFTDPTNWYLVMQYIEGETLDDYLKRTKGGYLPVKEVLPMGVQLAEVLTYLHERHPSIIFRDVKPANIMRTRRGHIYLIDFGIARRYDPDKTRDTTPLGSPGYAAPEQYGRAQSTPQTDMYGLGVTLNTLLMGREPLDDDPASPPARRPNHTERQLQQLLDRMQKPEAAERPRTMQEIKNHLSSLYQNTFGQRARSFLPGLLIGLPGWLIYLFLPFMRPASLALPHSAIPWYATLFAFVFIPLWFVIFFQWVFVFFCFLARPRHYLMGAGLLLMLVSSFLVGIFAHWIPALVLAFNIIFRKLQ